MQRKNFLAFESALEGYREYFQSTEEKNVIMACIFLSNFLDDIALDENNPHSPWGTVERLCEEHAVLKGNVMHMYKT
jgi:hypothetical protein